MSLDKMEEQFREIEEYPGYNIGNLGTIKNKHNVALKPWIHTVANNYSHYDLKVMDKNKNYKHVPPHRLIAMAWIPNPDNKPYIDHIDRDPFNNSIENLRWATPMENANNCGIRINNKSGITGLYVMNKKWVAKRTIMGIKYQKSFKERSEAEAYLREIIETPRFLTEETLAEGGE